MQLCLLAGRLSLVSLSVLFVPDMILILHGNTEHVAHVEKKNRSFLRISICSLSKHMPSKDHYQSYSRRANLFLSCHLTPFTSYGFIRNYKKERKNILSISFLLNSQRFSYASYYLSTLIYLSISLSLNLCFYIPLSFSQYSLFRRSPYIL